MNRNGNENAGSFPHFRVDVKHAFHDLDSGIDVAEPKAIFSPGPGGIKSVSVIYNLNDKLLSISLNEVDRSITGFAMLDV